MQDMPKRQLVDFVPRYALTDSSLPGKLIALCMQAAKHCQALGAPEVHTVEANLVLPKEVDKARPWTRLAAGLHPHGMLCQPVV